MSSVEKNSDLPRTGGGPVEFGLIGIKILKVILIIICIGLIDDPATNSHIRIFVAPRTIGLIYVTFGTFLITSIVQLITRPFGDICPWKTSALFTLVGLALFLTSTAMLFMDWSNAKTLGYWPPNTHRLDLICGTASLTLILTLLHIVELALTILYGISGDLD